MVDGQGATRAHAYVAMCDYTSAWEVTDLDLTGDTDS